MSDLTAHYELCCLFGVSMALQLLANILYVFCQQPLQFSKYLMGLRQLLMLNPFKVNECTILIRKVAEYFIRESLVRVTAKVSFQYFALLETV